ncbi:MAG TPA: glycerophosphodiester phosphodiesterase [Gaiellaceae bacterium]|nr:glycerophosphodiester phosphodiesterase [Gaiellaceae bacterium]
MTAPLVIAHRGLHRELPENTAAALAAAAAAGADGVELDVQQTAEGALVLHHDTEVAGEPIDSLPLARLRELRPPPLAPALDEALAAVPEDVLVVAELKRAPAAPVAAALRGRRHLFLSFLAGTLRDASDAAPGVPRGLLVGLGGDEPDAGELLRRAREARADFVAIEVRLAGDETLARTAAELAPSWVWTVNEERDLERLLGRDDVGAVVTDRPEEALRLRAARARAADGS